LKIGDHLPQYRQAHPDLREFGIPRLKNIRRLEDIGLVWVQFAARFPACVKPFSQASIGR
jgi:hypothetical protein